MLSALFPARIRRFVRPDAFEADIDLYFATYVRRTVTILTEDGDLLANDDGADLNALDAKYRGAVVYLRTGRVGLRDDAVELPVFVRGRGDSLLPFVPEVRK